jgi:hypothetical protein
VSTADAVEPHSKADRPHRTRLAEMVVDSLSQPDVVSLCASLNLTICRQ